MSNLNNSFDLTQEEEAQLSEDSKEKNSAAAENKPLTAKEPELSVGDYLKSKFVNYRAMPICVVS
jgi:hypothetical protein